MMDGPTKPDRENQKRQSSWRLECFFFDHGDFFLSFFFPFLILFLFLDDCFVFFVPSCVLFASCIWKYPESPFTYFPTTYLLFPRSISRWLIGVFPTPPMQVTDDWLIDWLIWFPARETQERKEKEREKERSPKHLRPGLIDDNSGRIFWRSFFSFPSSCIFLILLLFFLIFLRVVLCMHCIWLDVLFTRYFFLSFNSCLFFFSFFLLEKFGFLSLSLLLVLLLSLLLFIFWLKDSCVVYG